MYGNNCRRQQGEKPYANTAENHRYRTLPGEQPSDMLKFVRKIDSDNSNKITPDQVSFTLFLSFHQSRIF